MQLFSRLRFGFGPIGKREEQAEPAVHFISYPKSGRSWIRYMLRVLDADEAIGFHHDRFEFNNPSRPRHDYSIGPRKVCYSGRKVVYLRRDPRDVLVSLYFQITGRFGDKFNYAGSLSDFIRDPYFGAEPLRRFSLMWRTLASELPALLVTYEDFSADTCAETARLLDYLGISVPPERIRWAVDAASLEKMRALERSGDYPEPWLRLRNGAPKVREGKVGGFQTVLMPADIDYLNGIFKDVL